MQGSPLVQDVAQTPLGHDLEAVEPATAAAPTPVVTVVGGPTRTSTGRRTFRAVALHPLPCAVRRTLGA